MKQIWQEVRRFYEEKTYVICTILTAMLSYGFAICQPMIGVDDSAIGRYFSEGIGPIMGRFGYYLLNKICPVTDYTPFVTDFVGVLLLMLGATLWCVVWERAMGRRLSVMAGTAFACVMISCPMISEVFIYYLHNGICINYCLSALLILCFMEAMGTAKQKKISGLFLSILLLWVANSFVESFTIVFLMAVVMVWVLECIYGTRQITLKVVFTEGVSAGVVLAASVLLRSVAIEAVTFIFSLQDSVGIMNRRSILEALDWFQSGDGLAEFVMTIKKYIAMYYVNGIAYLPVRIYLLAVAAFCIYGVYRLLRYKQFLPLLGAAAMQAVPLILVVLEGHATFYRNSQFVPVYVAFVVLVLTCAVENAVAGKGWSQRVIMVWCILIGILVYNQSFEMTQWFYVDYMKYEDACNTVNQIAYELERDHDVEKPVVFVGNYTIPEHIVDKMYVDYDSETYTHISGILDIMDPNLKTCFAMPNGYSLSSEAVYSVFTWGNIAFEGWDKETHQFFAMHGHSFNRIENPEQCRDIQAQYQDIPGWPKAGSIVETDEYIVVHFG